VLESLPHLTTGKEQQRRSNSSDKNQQHLSGGYTSMNTKVAAGVFALALMFGVSTARAQDNPPAQDQSQPQDQTQTQPQDQTAPPAPGKSTQKMNNKGSQSITGCLQKGDNGGAYTLTADDGTVWHVNSKSVDLAPHVNHTVTLTGMGVEKSKEKSTATDSGETTDKSKEVHRLHVSKLSMVSESCQK
jgi:hypothetical protein